MPVRGAFWLRAKVIAAITAVVAGVVTGPALVAGSSTPPAPAAAVTPALNGPLHTTGTDSAIYDVNNQPVRLIGFNWNGTELGGRGDPQKIADVCGMTWQTPTDGLNGTTFENMYQVVRDLGYNVIRLPISWNDLEPVAPVWNTTTNQYDHNWNFTYLADLESIVSQARAAGLSVILDMHQDFWSPALHNITNANGAPGYCEGSGLPRWLFPSIDAKATTLQTVDFANGMNWFFRNVNDPTLGAALTHASPWQYLYSAWDLLGYVFSPNSGYADYSAVVGADLFNEPYSGYVGANPTPGQSVQQAAAARLTDFYNALGPAVTTQNPNLLLFFEDSTGAYNTADPSARDTPIITTKPTVPGNWVYSIHDYNFAYGTFSDGVAAHDDLGINVVSNALVSATAWKVPLYIGEFTTFSTKPDPRQFTADDLAETVKFVAWAKQNNVSWTFWAYVAPVGVITFVDPVTNQTIPAVQNALATGIGQPNQLPTAAFTLNCVNLVCTVDGTSSHDPDGPIASYAWTYGDGSTATGATPPAHTYPAGGTFPITLTVTDAASASNTVSHDAVATAPAAITPYAKDTFNRSVATGFGTADTGGAYATSGATSVVSGNGQLTVNKGGTTSAYLSSISQTDSDTTVTVTTDKAGTGGGVYLAVLGRRVSAGTDYQGRIRLTSTKSVALSLVSEVANTATTLAGEQTLPGVTYTPGLKLTLRLQVTGTKPTTLRLKVWPAGTTEPTGWSLTTSNTAAPLQASGSVGFWTYLSGSATNAPITMKVSNLTVQPTSTIPVPPPTNTGLDAFNRSVAAGFGVADVGGSWTTTGTTAVSPANGGMLITAKGGTASAYLPSTGSTSVDVQATVASDKAATGGGAYVAVLGRRVASGLDYQGRIRLTSTGAIAVSIVSEVGGTTTTLAGETILPGVAYTAGLKLTVRLQVTGTNPTTLRLKVWPAGGVEPAAWTLTATNSTAALQTSGPVGLWAYLSGSATNGPTTMKVTSFRSG